MIDEVLSMFDAFCDEGQDDDPSQVVNKYEKEGFHANPGFVGNSTTSLASCVRLEKLEAGHNCTHHRLCPSDYKNEWKETFEPAKTYPFVLDDFQKHSIECLENNESVLVCAHTSAGKTAVAEYAIAMGLRDKRRIVYTSPIKALSNQKYRNLSDEFVDVGLMTGDVTLNPNASVMVMTTEILRSMLYRGSEIVQEMKWVIFDEVHYMRDYERGVVWEETIILIPQQVHLVFLSATIPNSLEFAEWICRIKNMPCNVISTDYRPTPLQHYVFPSKASGIYLVLDESNKFRQDTFVHAINQLESGKDGSGRRKRGRYTKEVEAVVGMCHERGFTPVIVFAFSKADCEANATAVRHLDMTDDSEKTLIGEIYKNAMATLSDEDRKLPQAVFMLPLLKNGIGIHHGGLLPIIKEIIEILFQEGLVKVLFSTETFSMGINMPARSVVFTNLRKWDGHVVRLITSGEYIQMAGRAGRRGLDEHGLVIIMLEEGIKPEEAKGIFLGEPNKLESSFRFGYNMLLNLMRIEDTTPEFMIERSFLQFQRGAKSRQCEAQLPALIRDIEDQKSKIGFEFLTDLSRVHVTLLEIEKLKRQVSEIVIGDAKLLNYLNFGRLLRLVDGDVDWGWGICFAPSVVKQSSQAGRVHVVDSLVLCDSASLKNKNSPPLPTDDLDDGVFLVVPFALECIREISQIRMSIRSDFRSNSELCQAEMRAKYRQLKDYMATFPQVPLLDPIEHMKITSAKLPNLLKAIKEKELQLKQFPIISRNDFDKLYSSYEKLVDMQTQERKLREDIEQSHQIVMRDELRRMKGVLRSLNYVGEDGVVTIKGRIACEINITDELVVAELFLRNFFENMAPEYICASLSCLVVDEKKDEKMPSDPKLIENFNKIRDIAGDIAQVMVKNKIEISPADFVNKFRPTLMTIVLRWAKGESFTDILSDSTVFEGSVIRCVRRLEELLRQLACTSRGIGNLELEKVFITSIKILKRGIIFTSSLYL